MKKAYKHIILSTTTAMLLIACGGGNGSSNDKNQTILIDKPQQASDKPKNVSTKLAKAQLGVLSGATVKIEELGIVPYKIIAEEVTSAGDSIESIGNFDAHSESYDKNKFYLISVSGGLDMDVNDDGKIDPFPKLNKGTFHAIVKGENAKEVNGAFKVTTASEIVYKKVESDIDNTSTLEEKLDESAKEIFQKGTDDDKEVTNSDILNYDPIKDKENFHEDYQDILKSIIKDIHEDKKNEIIKTPPIAKAGGDISIVEGKEVILSARGLDSDGNIISYAWSEYGKTISDNREFTYTPDTLGLHTLTLTVVDNDNLTSTDRVNITVLQKPNNYPIADKQTITIDEDSQKKITLTAKDSDDDSLTYKIIQEPINGMLSGKAPNFIYKPDTNFNGEDSIIFVANDGKADSKKETITIYIKPSNDKPVILFDGDSITTEEDTTKRFTLKAQDQEDDKLTYTITQKPKSGVLTHKNDNFNYTPNFNFNGSDSFIVTVKDGNGGEDSKKINVTVTPINDAPTVDIGDSKSMLAGESITLRSDAKDIDGKVVKYEWREDKKLLSNKASFTYKQEDIGNHTITLTITDDKGATATQRVVVHVSEVPNKKPKSENLSIKIKEDTSTNITLKSSDEDEDKLTYKILQSPFHGTLSGKAPNVSYSPIKDYFGKDSFTYRANDGKDDSNIAKVSIIIDDVIEADTTAPVIDLHGSATMSVTPKTKFVIPTPTAKDDRDGVVKVITTGKVDFKKMGTYKLIYTATDKAGNKTTKTRTIKVLAPLDWDAPVITLSGASMETVIQGSKIYLDQGATAKDSVDGHVSVKNEGKVDLTKIGTYKITYTAVDKHKNKATKTRTVNVIAPTYKVTPTLVGNKLTVKWSGFPDRGLNSVHVYISGGKGGSHGYSERGGSGEKVLTIDRADYTTYQYTLTMSDYNNKTVFTKKFDTKPAKIDKTAPIITLRGKAEQILYVGDKYSEVGTTIITNNNIYQAKDEADGYVNVTISGKVDTSKAGTYKVTYAAIDKAGNKAIKIRTVKVVTPNYKVTPTLVGNKLTIKWSGFPYHANFHISRSSKSSSFTERHSSGEKVLTLDRADYDTYHYTLTMRDYNNKIVFTKKFDVKPAKIDKTAPVIKLLGEVEQTLYIGSTYVEKGTGIRTGDRYVAYDRFDGYIDVIISGIVNTSKAGIYKITYTATDKSGNRATKIRTIKVLRSKAPVITMEGLSTITLFQGEKFREPGVSAKDDRDGVVSVTTSGKVDTSKPGKYTLTYMAVDSEGNRATKRRVVEVFKSEYKVSTSFDEKNIIIDWESFPRAYYYIEVSYLIKYSNGTTEKRKGTVFTSRQRNGSKSLYLYTHNVAATITVYDSSKKVIATQNIKIPSEASLSPLPKVIFDGKHGEDYINVKIGDTAHLPKPKAYSKKYGQIPVKVVAFRSVYSKKSWPIKNTFVVTSDMATSGGILIVLYEATDKDGNIGKGYVVYKVAKDDTPDPVSPDTRAPIITLKGNFRWKDQGGTLRDYYPRQELHGAYKEDGVTAIDGRDGKVSVKISYGKLTKSLFSAGKPSSKTGIYVVFYTAKDKAGNKAVRYKTVLSGFAAWYPSYEYENTVRKYINDHFSEF